MDRYICIHGHFYQPPRENPWLEAVELQDSAYPYHDWNERVTAESYGPNASARVLGPGGKITRLSNNYSRISFNLGPTLLSWIETGSPEVYRQIVEADRESQERFGGHGSAIAQAYNHMIMPLANRRDKVTQVRWGIYDFQHRFGRRPEGMWLPETAVDLETLEVLAAERILFTILAPHQAARVQPLEGEKEWHDVSGAKIDPSQAYRAILPSGETIALFFYDGPVSRAVAFEHLLNNGETFASRLTNIFAANRNWPQLAHIATDGETYGHHHRYGEMALARALDFIEEKSLAKLINYGQYLELYPPTQQVEIYEDTSWSCPHGIERWRSNCGCNSGGHAGWTQEWRRPLREAVDWLRDELAHCHQENAPDLFQDCWAARDDYIAVVLDRSPETVDSFFKQHAARELSEGEKVRALKLMELQRHAMLMYTSCGWFFDELSGIETVQVIEYAARALQLAQELGIGQNLEQNFLDHLARAHSNIPANGDGRQVYERFVRGSMVDLPKVAAHYAMTSLFKPYPHTTQIYCYQVNSENYTRDEFGRSKLAIGKVQIESEITRETEGFHFAAMHFGDQNLVCGIDRGSGEQAHDDFLREAQSVFQHDDLPQLLQTMDRHFGEMPYTLRTMFRDEQRRTLAKVLEPILSETENVYQRLYDEYMPLMRFITHLNSPLPAVFQPVPALALNTALRRSLEVDDLEVEEIKRLLEEAREIGVTLDADSLGYTLRTTLERLAGRIRDNPDNIVFLRRLATAVTAARSVPFEVPLDMTQDIYYHMQQDRLPRVKEKAEKGDPKAWFWVDLFLYTGDQLGFKVRDD